MIALAATIARTELDRRFAAALIMGYGVAAAVIGLASDDANPYPVLTEGVRSLVLLGVVWIAIGALLAVRPSETGLNRELLLAGIDPRKRRCATAIVAVAVAILGWAIATVLASGVATAWLTLDEREVALSVEGGRGALAWVALGISSAGILGLIGAAIGLLARSRSAALAATVLLAAPALLLPFFGEFPPSLWLRSLFPTGAVYGLLGDFDGIRGQLAFKWGVPAAYALAASCIVAVRALPSDGVLRPRRVSREAEASATPGALILAPVAILVASAALFGATVPTRIADQVPWWLRGDWIADLARGTDSEPAARAYLDAIRSGDRSAESDLIRGRPAAVIDPLIRARVRRAGGVHSIEYFYDDISPPGTVSAQLAGPVHSASLYICLVRTDQGWRVVGVDPDTPTAC